MHVHARYLGAFLATRLLGYALFAAVVWEVGGLISFSASAHLRIFSLIQALLGVVLLHYAYSVGRACAKSPRRTELVSIGSAGTRRRIPEAAALGLLTGVSLCPPFIAASVRAAECSSISGAILFFVAFFVGTSFWFVPFAAFAWLRRNEAVTTVARMAMALIGLFYLYLGLMSLIGRS
jgi:sulfite exporter TauE/SafE